MIGEIEIDLVGSAAYVTSSRRLRRLFKGSKNPSQQSRFERRARFDIAFGLIEKSRTSCQKSSFARPATLANPNPVANRLANHFV